MELFAETAENPRGSGNERGGRKPSFATGPVPKSANTNTEFRSAVTMERVAEVSHLRRAFEKVASNKGAPGPDGWSIEEVEPHLPELLPRLSTALLEETYRPGEIRRVWIPKPAGGKRGLGIPNVIDRTVQQAVHNAIWLLFEPSFHDSSHGFRPGRSCHTAIKEAKGYLESGTEWVVDIDLEKFFDRVHHQRLLSRLEAKGVKDPRLLRLIRRMLEAKIVMPEGVVLTPSEGTPQGGPLSPLLSNIVLDELDQELARRGHRFVRYADDCKIYVGSERAGQRVMKSVSSFIERRLRLKVNESKSAVARSGDRSFLGFRLVVRWPGRIAVRLSDRSSNRIKARLTELTPRNWGGPLERCIERITRYLQGWLGHFGILGPYEAARVLTGLDAHLLRRLRAIVLRQKRRKRSVYRWFVRRGVGKVRASVDVYGGHRSLWALTRTPSALEAMPVEFFSERGLKSLVELWEDRRSRPITASGQLRLDLG